MIKHLGHALLVIGTIVASLGGAKLPSASWTISGVGLALLLAAVVCLRYPDRRGSGAVTAAAADVRSLLDRLPARIEELASEARALELGAVPARIDGLVAELVSPIAESSPKLLGELGARRFADVFGAFASAERALARAWSAAADGHAEEAHASLERAVVKARAALSALG